MKNAALRGKSHAGNPLYNTTKLKSLLAVAAMAAGLMATAEPTVTVDKVERGDPWNTIRVSYTLGGVEEMTYYKVAFDVTANGVTRGVTNAATKVADGVQTPKAIDTVELFGKATPDTKAKVRVSLIAITKPLGVQLWANGPFWAESNLGIPESAYADHPEYGALYTIDDAKAEVEKLGDGWRLPTKDEWQALLDNCTRTWDSDKKGYTFTGKGIFESNSIFLPVAGYSGGSGIRGNVGKSGHYCTSTESPDPDRTIDCACYEPSQYGFDKGVFFENNYRSYEISVRRVRGTAE